MHRTIIALLALAGLSACAQSPQPTRLDTLYPQARETLLQRLQAPATLRVVDSTYFVIVPDGDTLHGVQITYDAENGFGALLRGQFRAFYEQTGPDSVGIDSYRLYDTSL